MNTRSQARGFTLVEVFVALAFLGISGAAELSRRRTDMTVFALTRLERVATRTRSKVPTATTTTPVDCSAMAVAGAFDPNAAPGTGGWMLDVIDGNPPAGGGTLGDDMMAGPLLVEGDSGPDTTNTLSKRASFASAWIAGTDRAGCGSNTVLNDRTVFCREIHVEPVDVTAGGVTTFMLRVWVRVIQGGVPWQNSNVMIRQDIVQ